jgi:hypothetical protein
MTLNQFTIGTEGAGAELLEFLKTVQPGDRLKLQLDNGVSKIEGTLLVDEHTDDRLAARVKMKGGQTIGGVDDMEDDGEEDEGAAVPAPKSGAGASAAAVLGLKSWEKLKGVA